MHDTPSMALFQQLFEANRDKIFRFAYKLVGDTSRAQEITQQCFIKLWENMHKVQEGQDVFPLLFVYVKHIVIDETRRLYREKQHLAQLSSQQPVTEAYEDDHSLMRKEFEQQLKKLIEKMPEQRKQVYQLSREHGQSHKEIAAQLSLSPATVRNHLNLALQYIRREILTHYDIESK